MSIRIIFKRRSPSFFIISFDRIIAAQSSLFADYVYSDPKLSQLHDLLRKQALCRLVRQISCCSKWTTPGDNSLHHTLSPQDARNAPQNIRVVRTYSTPLTKLVVSVSSY